MTLLYLFKDQGTIKGVPEHIFNAAAAAQKLRRSFKGLNTDERTIIEVLTNHTNSQRQEIKKKYQEYYGREINKVKQTYFDRYATLLEEDLENITPALGKFLRTILIKGRSESENLDHDLAESDAADLIPTNPHSIKVTNGTAFSSLLCLRNRSQIALTLDYYKKNTGVDLETSIRKEFTGETQFGLIAFIRVIQNPVVYFAELFNASLKGIKTDDETLVRIFVSRSEIDLEAIKMEYQRRYKMSLSKSVRNDCSGDYGRLLLKIINNSGHL